jgi:hypothetical protein
MGPSNNKTKPNILNIQEFRKIKQLNRIIHIIFLFICVNISKINRLKVNYIFILLKKSIQDIQPLSL